MAQAAAPLAARIARGPLAGELGAAVGANTDGDIQKALDLYADAAFEAALTGASVRALASEEREAPTALNPDGKYLVAIDPLDGSSNIDVNVTIGTIFAVLPAPERGGAETADFLQPGHRQCAAGMFVYGPHAALVFTLGAGTHVAALDPDTREFGVARRHIHIPEGRPEYRDQRVQCAPLAGPVRAYVDDCLMGETGPRAKDFNMRWIASLVADAFRVLQRGGAYLYPDDARAGYAQGRLRLVYEANPIALLVEQAGGLAIDGVNRILDIPPGEPPRAHAADLRLDRQGRAYPGLFRRRASFGGARAAVRPPRPVALKRTSGSRCLSSIPSSRSRARPAPARPRSSARSSRFSGARRSTPSISRATPSIAGTAWKCARR